MQLTDWVSNGLHLAVALMCFSFWWMGYRVMKLQRRQYESKHHDDLCALNRRIADAVEDWYADKKNSKEKLLALAEQQRRLRGNRRYDGSCHLCEAGPYEPCDAGLHG